MLPRLRPWHYAVLVVVASWLSWKKELRWALAYNQVRALWILFKCRDMPWLVGNLLLSLYASYSSRLIGLENMLALCYLSNIAAYSFSTRFLIANRELLAAVYLLQAYYRSENFVRLRVGECIVTENAAGTVLLALWAFQTPPAKVLAVMCAVCSAVLASRYSRSGSYRFRCIKKLRRFVDPSIQIERS